MDLTGERRLPAARHVIWHALSDPATLADSVPPDLTIRSLGDGTHGLTLAGSHGDWVTQASTDARGSPAQTVFNLVAPHDGQQAFGGRVEFNMAEDGVFTRLLWRVSTDLSQSEATRIEAIVDHVLTHVGQRAATPEPVAAQGLAGAAAAIVNSDTVASKGSPLQVIARTLAAMPRDSTIGGAAFILVVLFVVGIL